MRTNVSLSFGVINEVLFLGYPKPLLDEKPHSVFYFSFAGPWLRKGQQPYVPARFIRR